MNLHIEPKYKCYNFVFMNLLRKSLFPLSLLYDVVTRVRNAAFDKQWLRQSQFDVPTIVVGNLITGVVVKRR